MLCKSEPTKSEKAKGAALAVAGLAAEKAVEAKVKTEKGLVKVTPQDHFIKICHDELEALMGPVDTSLRFADRGRPTGPARRPPDRWRTPAPHGPHRPSRPSRPSPARSRAASSSWGACAWTTTPG